MRTTISIFCLLFLLHLPSSFRQEYVLIDCDDDELAVYCECSYEGSRFISYLACKDGFVNKIPDTFGIWFKAQNAFDSWPVIPQICQKLIYLILDKNKIDSIGDVSNLINVRGLNISWNRITKFDSTLASLKYLETIDLSHNLIEQVDLGDLMFDPGRDRDLYVSNTTKATSERLFSSLRKISFVGNRIKIIHGLDLLFIGMPSLDWAVFAENNLTFLEIARLSPHSEKIIQKMSNDDVKIANMTLTQYIVFNQNRIAHVHLNFDYFRNEVFNRYEKYYFVRFMSVSFLNQLNVTINCDCGLYSDVKFMHELFVKFAAKINIKKSDLAKIKCFKNYTEYDLYDAISANDVQNGEFCSTNSPSTDSMTPQSINRVTSATVGTFISSVVNSTRFSTTSQINATQAKNKVTSSMVKFGYLRFTSLMFGCVLAAAFFGQDL